MAQQYTDPVIERLLKEEDLPEVLRDNQRHIKDAIEVTELKLEHPEYNDPPKQGEEQECNAEHQAVLKANIFVQKTLPAIVRFILRTKYQIQASRDACTKFLQYTLKLIIAWMPLDEPMLVKLLTEIFDEDMKFYIAKQRLSGEYSSHNYGHGHHFEGAMSPSFDSPLSTTDEERGEYAIFRKFSSAAPTLIELLNYFGENGGFSGIVDTVCSEDSKVRFVLVEYYLRAIDNIRNMLKDSFLEKYALELKDAVFNLILNMGSEKFKTISKASLVYVVEVLSSIISVKMRSEQVGEITEKFQLDVSLKCLKSPSLEKRLQGLQVINSLISMIARKEYKTSTGGSGSTSMGMGGGMSAGGAAGGYNSSSMYRGYTNTRVMVPTTKWLTSTEMIHWIIENNVIDEFFGNKLHHELLKRANELFKFLASKGEFSSKYIDLLWDSSVGKQEAVVDAIYKIFKDLVAESVFDKDLFQHLLSRIVEISPEAYEPNLLSLLQEVEIHFITKNLAHSPTAPNALRLLWNVMQDESNVSDEIFNTTKQCLFGIFESVRQKDRALKELRSWVVEQCVVAIQQHKSTTQMYEILRNIISLSPKRVYQTNDSRIHVIEGILKTHSLIDLFFEDLQHYCTYVKTLVDSDSSYRLDPSKLDHTRVLPGSHYTHLQLVGTRLNFFLFLVKSLPQDAQYPGKYLGTLWNCVVVDAFTPQQRDLAYDWFYTFNDKVPLKSKEALLTFFETQLTKQDFSQLSKCGFRCFETFFKATNLKLNKLAQINHAGDIQISDKELNLVGADCLWEIAFNNHDETLALDVIYYVSELYDSLPAALRARREPCRESFVMKIMDKLEDAASVRVSVGMEHSQFRIERCLRLLKQFLDQCDPVPSKPSPEEKPFHLTLQYENSQRKQDFVVYPSTLLREIRERLAHAANNPSGSQHSSSSYVSSAYDYAPESIVLSINRPRRVVFEKREYYLSLSDVGIDESTIITYKLSNQTMQRSHASTMNNTASSMYYYKDASASTTTTSGALRRFLSDNTKCFDLLFDLLDFNETIGEKVWALICDLPKNPNLFARIKEQHQINWEELLATTSTLKLLYSLQVINDMIFTATSNTTAPTAPTTTTTAVSATGKKAVSSVVGVSGDEQQQLWCDAFVKNQGFKRLFDIFINHETLITGRLRKKCLESLLHTINYFILSSSTTTTSNATGNATASSGHQLEDDASTSSSTDDAGEPLEPLSPALSSTNNGAIGEVVPMIRGEYEWIQWEQLVTVLLHVIWDCARDQTASAEISATNCELVKHAGTLLVACMSSNASLLPSLLQFSNLHEFVHCVLLETPEQSIRYKLSHGIIHLCHLYATCRSVFITMLLSFLPRIVPSSQSCPEYFYALTDLLKDVFHQQQQHKEAGHAEEEEEGGDAMAIESQPNANSLLSQILTLILKHPHVEEEGHPARDLVLIGQIHLLGTVLFAVPELKHTLPLEFVEFLYNECLFGRPTATHHRGPNPSPICIYPESRKSVIDLLRLLTLHTNTHSNGEQYGLIIQLMANSQNTHKTTRKWNYSPVAEQRAPVGYAGIKNLGCICYMNSLMQQLFMMPKFRRGILSLPDHELKLEPNQHKSDNLIYQLQRMFTGLQETHKLFYDPSDFCKANKDYDGQPTDVSLQMDVDEFFNMVCEKVEEGLKKTQQENLLKNIWCGNLCSQLICQECKYISERDEAFFTVSLDLKNKASINEALDFYVQGELLTGGDAYFCEKCNKKVDALMRRCLKSLPSTLILHLKRFEFNYDTMRKLKLNDYCEFPANLNMKPFTKEGLQEIELEKAKQSTDSASASSAPTSDPRNDSDAPTAAATASDTASPAASDTATVTPTGAATTTTSTSDAPDSDPMKTDDSTGEEEVHGDDYYNYVLVGILVHSGIADSGHYYSFIKLRNAYNQEPSAQWLQFNDETVTPFDESHIERECFGGKEDDVSDTMSRYSRPMYRTRNAYMLIYERLNNIEPKYPLPTPTPSSNDQKDSSDAMDTTSFGNLVITRKKEENFEVAIPTELYDEVWLENNRFATDKRLYDSDYARFCLDMINNYVGVECMEPRFLEENELEPVKVMTLFLLRILSHSREKQVCQAIAGRLQQIISKHVPACLWLLDYLTQEKDENLLEMVLLSCNSVDIRVSISELLKTALLVVTRFEAPFLNSRQQAGVASKFVDKLIGFMTVLPYYWRTFSQYFHLLAEFARSGMEQRKYLMAHRIIVKIYSLIVHGTVDETYKTPRMGDKTESPNFGEATSILAILVLSSNYRVSDMEEYDEEDEEEEEDELSEENPMGDRTPGDKLDIPLKLVKYLQSSQFLKPLVKNNPNAVGEMISFWSWSSRSLQLLDFVLKNINDVEYDELEIWCRMLGQVLEVPDKYQSQRVAKSLEAILDTLKKFKKYPKYTKNLATAFFSLYFERPSCKVWMDKNKPKWAWVQQYMESHNFPIKGLTPSTTAPATNPAWNNPVQSSSQGQPRGNVYSSRPNNS